VNLALPALVILLGVLPGIACFYGYFASRFDKRTAGLSGVEELALYVVFALPINAISLIVCRRIGIPFHFDVATRLLTASLTDVALKEVAADLQRVAVTSSFAYLVTLVVSYGIGSACRRCVWMCRLDVWVPMLRLKPSWYYILQGRLRGLPRRVVSYVDVLTTLSGEPPDNSRLYRGIVIDFEISSSGGIDSLTLIHALRSSGRGDKFTWKNIPSDRLLIVGTMIHSINLTYFALEEPVPSHKSDRVRHEISSVWRRFVFEEP
jgi:hypothetical protein